MVNSNLPMEKLKSSYEIPSWVVLESVDLPRDPCNVANGHWIHNLAVMQGGLTFPPNQFFLEFFQFFDIVPAACSPNVWRIVNGIHRLNQIYGTSLGLTELRYCYQWIQTHDGSWYLRARQPGTALVVNLPDSNKRYYKYGFIVRTWQYNPDAGEYFGPRCPDSGCIIAVDKKGIPSDEEINKEDLLKIWGENSLVGEDHCRSASFLLEYPESTTSFISSPVGHLPHFQWVIDRGLHQEEGEVRKKLKKRENMEKKDLPQSEEMPRGNSRKRRRLIDLVDDDDDDVPIGKLKGSHAHVKEVSKPVARETTNKAAPPRPRAKGKQIPGDISVSDLPTPTISSQASLKKDSTLALNLLRSGVLPYDWREIEKKSPDELTGDAALTLATLVGQFLGMVDNRQTLVRMATEKGDEAAKLSSSLEYERLRNAALQEDLAEAKRSLQEAARNHATELIKAKEEAYDSGYAEAQAEDMKDITWIKKARFKMGWDRALAVVNTDPSSELFTQYMPGPKPGSVKAEVAQGGSSVAAEVLVALGAREVDEAHI